MFIRLPKKSDMACDRYVTPFSYGLWLAGAIAACAISIFLALTNKGREKNRNLTVSAILFYIHACFCQQGESYKFLFLTLYIYVFIFHTLCNPVTSFHSSVSLELNLLFQIYIYTLTLHFEKVLLNSTYLNVSFSILLTSFRFKTKIYSLQYYGQ